MDYYIVITSDDVIWGVGQSKNKAKADALVNFKEFYGQDQKNFNGKVLPATESLHDEVITNGYTVDMWEIVKIGDIWKADLKKVIPKITQYLLSGEKEITI